MTAKTKHLITFTNATKTTNDDGTQTVTTTTVSYVLKLLPYYAGTDNNINVAQILGVTPIIPGTTVIPPATPTASIEELLKNGVIRAFRARVLPTTTGSTAVASKLKHMYCAASNAVNISQIIGGTFQQGYTFVDAYLPQHFTFGI